MIETRNTVVKKVVEYETFKILKSKLNLNSEWNVTRYGCTVYSIWKYIFWARNLLVEQSKTQERDVEIEDLRGLKKQRRETFQQQILGHCCQLLAPISGQSRSEIRLQRIKVAHVRSCCFGVYFWSFGKMTLWVEKGKKWD